MPELRIPAKVANINRAWGGAYFPYMTWGEPDHQATVTAMQTMHKNIGYYREKAKAVRLKAMREYAPDVLGLAMRRRVQQIHSCICLLLKTSTEYKAYFPEFETTCATTPESYWSHLTISHCTNEVVGFRKM